MLKENNEYLFLNGSNFEVRLLISNLKEARKISLVFRQAGIIPLVYEDFTSFYTDSISSKELSLSIIDVKKMSQGLMKLKGHPAIKSGAMQLAFYYSEESFPLLYSAYELFNFGLIKECSDYKGQVKSILRRYNLFQVKEHQIVILEEEKEEIKKVNRKTFEVLEKYKENAYYDDSLFSMCEKFEKEKSNISFFESCEDVFASIPEILGFSFFELSTNGHKLVSPPSGSKKFHKLPSLWLGQGLENGIEFFAQNMANQVALDVLGADIMCLMIKGRYEHPEKLLFVKVGNEDFLNKFKWNIFEDYISNVYTFFLAKGNAEIEDDYGHLDSFTFLNILDEARYYENKTENLYLVDVDLSDLMTMVRLKNEIRFFWKEFFRDFIRYFKGKFGGDFYYTTVNSEHISFLVDQEKSELFLRSIKKYSQRFSYWRYFEDRDAVFTRDVSVVVRSLPVSSHAFLSYVNGHENLYNNENLKNSKSEPFLDAIQ